MVATDILNQPYTLSKEQIEFYNKHRYIKLKDVLDEDTLNYYNVIISNKVDELNDTDIPLAERSTYGKAFLQLFNLWVQDDIIKEVIPHIQHIHARIGFEQSPQVNNPFAPEWEFYLKQFTTWWRAILKNHVKQPQFTITPEFGPYPYMPEEPFTRKPLANQSDLNLKMKDYLKTILE